MKLLLAVLIVWAFAKANRYLSKKFPRFFGDGDGDGSGWGNILWGDDDSDDGGDD